MEKTAYFEPDNVDRVAESMLGELAEFRERHPASVDPARAALVVLDVQEYFADASSPAFVPSLPTIIPRIEALVRVFKTAKRPAFLTRHVDSTDPSGEMLRWWQRTLEVDDERSELIEGMSSLDIPVVIKKHYDAFIDTDLDQRLRSAGIQQVVVAGTLAHLCCETTARAAFMRGYEVFMTIDGIATFNDAFHRATLLNLSHGFASPVLCSEVTQWMGVR
ncbi:isochorismatase family protein [Candidatus Bipolaricaulota bacterium]